ncbi:anti-sigma regulatory factor (Ser/Thr protein kinase) [Streptomyces sp. V3I8]|uniref:ATP-binding protein n=1 Tax=Streptomyces sp. V3I8 TaxID=3042279 RepID=UPI00277F8B11|nr:ATP-binding protein [Streptomyces sp. V3I8]MDQ1038138.1 anti-sigma regulatory factor (Ser/Thr protein kinase) [Streptomyces sp. V3I8]
MNQETVRSFSLLLSATPRGARLARRFTSEQLRTWALPLDPARAEHIVAELAANAITHGRVPGRDFRLTLYVVGGTLRIEVTDTRGDRPVRHPRQHGPVDESGRGLVIVEALCDRWGVTPGRPPRKTVWAEINFVPQPQPQPRTAPTPRPASTGPRILPSR